MEPRRRSLARRRRTSRPLIVGAAFAFAFACTRGLARAEPEPMPLAQPAPTTSLPALPPPPSSPAPSATPRAFAPAPAPVPKPCECVSGEEIPGCPCADPSRKASPGSFVLGVRLQVTQVKAPSGDADSVGVTFSGRVESHNDEHGIVASRGGLSFGIGGGSGDVEGIFGAAALIGVRAPVSRFHAPFLRVGIAGEYQGNARYLLSRFDLPLGELGYQFVRRTALFEAGARMSPVLTGRLRGGADTRVLSSAFSFGGFLTARGEAGRVDLLYTRVQTTDGVGRAVDSFQGIGCVLPFGVFALCVDGQIVDTSVSLGPTTQALRAAYFGGLLGLGMAGQR